MVEDPQPQKIPLIFYRTLQGSEPVREWLKELSEVARIYQENAHDAGG